MKTKPVLNAAMLLALFLPRKRMAAIVKNKFLASPGDIIGNKKSPITLTTTVAGIKFGKIGKWVEIDR